MLAGRNGIPAPVARQARHRILALQGRNHVASRRVLTGEKDPDLHDASNGGRVASMPAVVDDCRQRGKATPRSSPRIYPSFPRKRESRAGSLYRLPWAPAFAGATNTVEAIMESFIASDGLRLDYCIGRLH
jgi:hypothetical protein